MSNGDLDVRLQIIKTTAWLSSHKRTVCPCNSSAYMLGPSRKATSSFMVIYHGIWLPRTFLSHLQSYLSLARFVLNFYFSCRCWLTCTRSSISISLGTKRTSGMRVSSGMRLAHLAMIGIQAARRALCHTGTSLHSRRAQSGRSILQTQPPRRMAIASLHGAQAIRQGKIQAHKGDHPGRVRVSTDQGSGSIRVTARRADSSGSRLSCARLATRGRVAEPLVNFADSHH